VTVTGEQVLLEDHVFQLLHGAGAGAEDQSPHTWVLVEVYGFVVVVDELDQSFQP